MKPGTRSWFDVGTSGPSRSERVRCSARTEMTGPRRCPGPWSISRIGYPASTPKPTSAIPRIVVVESPPEGGLTGFADGIQLYRAVSPALRDKFEGLEILYHPKLMFVNMRYGRPRRLGSIVFVECAHG